MTVNEQFAKKYDSKKKREELAELQERCKDAADEDASTDSESLEEEDEDGELLTPALDAQILQTIAKVKSRNKDIYDQRKSFFVDDELRKAEADWRQRRKKRERPVTLGDYQRKQLLAGEGEGEEESKDEGKDEIRLTHEQEQRAIKQEFQRVCVLDDKAGGDFLRVRPKTEEQMQHEEEEYKNFLLENLGNDENMRESMGNWLQYRQHPAALKDEDHFLIDYVLNRGWIDAERKKLPSYDAIVADEIEDEEHVEKMEEFEERYNFRFEQPGAERVVTFARQIEGSMRREDDARKRQREAKKLRRDVEKGRQLEELKRLKNLKKEEIREKLDKIKKVAGTEVEGIDLESDFDPDEHDRKMAKLFDSKFYEREEKKPRLSDSDDEPIASTTKRVMRKAAKSIEKSMEQKKGPNQSFVDYLDEYYALDYEDKIGTLSCRFKYSAVVPASFGLEAHDILQAQDAELNAHVSLKKLAPYRAREQQEADIKKYSDKRRVYMFHNKHKAQKAKHQ